MRGSIFYFDSAVDAKQAIVGGSHYGTKSFAPFRSGKLTHLIGPKQSELVYEAANVFRGMQVGGHYPYSNECFTFFNMVLKKMLSTTAGLTEACGIHS